MSFFPIQFFFLFTSLHFTILSRFVYVLIIFIQYNIQSIFLSHRKPEKKPIRNPIYLYLVLTPTFKYLSLPYLQLKLTKVASGIIALWVLAWTPYAVVALLGIFRQRAVITPLVSMVPAFFCKTAACLDPCIYALSHPRFKVILMIIRIVLMWMLV